MIRDLNVAQQLLFTLHLMSTSGQERRYAVRFGFWRESPHVKEPILIVVSFLIGAVEVENIDADRFLEPIVMDPCG